MVREALREGTRTCSAYRPGAMKIHCGEVDVVERELTADWMVENEDWPDLETVIHPAGADWRDAACV